MKARCFLKVIVILTCSAPYFLVFGQCDIPRPITSECLLSLKAIPEYIEATYEGDECFRQIVALGIPIALELIDLLDDPTLSDHMVPHWGGHYAVGDIALNILIEMIRMPVVDLLPVVNQRDYETCGFCVYWKYVRDNPKNRIEFQSIIEDWFIKNQDSLCWKEIHGVPSGGQYLVKVEGDA